MSRLCRRCERSRLRFFFFNDPATTEIYTLSLHDALPISGTGAGLRPAAVAGPTRQRPAPARAGQEGLLPACSRGGIDRKSTRLNSSHLGISYAVFCLKNQEQTLRKRRLGEAVRVAKVDVY